jgi:hypothetical protein
MIWILLAAIGIPVWLLVGVLALVLVSRRRFVRRPEVFACRIVATSRSEKPSGGRRGKRYAYWVHDVLLVHRGLALLRYEPFPVASVADPLAAAKDKGLGDQAVRLRLHLDDGGQVDLLFGNEDLTPATGPFVTAAQT